MEGKPFGSHEGSTSLAALKMPGSSAEIMIGGLRKHDVFGDHASALRRENQRLLATNNNLQLRLIEMNETKDEELGKMSEVNRKLKEKLATVTFLLKSRAASVKEMEDERRKMKTQIDRLTHYTSKGSKFPTPEMIISKNLPESAEKQGIATKESDTKNTETEHALIRSLRDRVAILESELGNRGRDNAQLRTENQLMNDRILARQDELKRLANLLERERNWDRIAAENAIARKDFEIKKLNDQIDILNEAKVKVEQEAQIAQKRDDAKDGQAEEMNLLQEQNKVFPYSTNVVLIFTNLAFVINSATG